MPDMTSLKTYQSRKKYQRIRCPKCNSTSRKVGTITASKIPGFQFRKCSNKNCEYEFTYNYVTEADMQFKKWKGVTPK